MTNTITNSEFEELRAKYCPRFVKFLMIGESRPENDTFFYLGNSNLFQYTHNAFSRFLGRNFPTPKSFLDYFRKAGFYLDDLCPGPVNNMERGKRRLAREEGIAGLSNRIKVHSPKAVICVMKGIASHINQAVSRSGVRLELGLHLLPFPTNGHQIEYQIELEQILKKLSIL